MEVYLDGLTLKDCEQVRLWRNQSLASLRTSRPLTAAQQEAFYRETVCNRASPHYYQAVRFGDPHWRYDSDVLIGSGGLTFIDYENGRAEISLILGPAFIGKGYGRAAVKLLLALAFERMRLVNVTGICYDCNPRVGFWRKMVAEHNGEWTSMSRLKHWGGEMWAEHSFKIEKPPIVVNVELDGKEIAKAIAPRMSRQEVAEVVNRVRLRHEQNADNR